jgi:hypothetical protein
MNITYVDNIISEQIQSYQRCKNKLKSIDGIYNFKNKKKTSKSIYFTFEKSKSNNNNHYNNGFTVDDYKIDDIKEIRVSIIYNQIEYNTNNNNNNNNGCNIIHTFKNPDKVLSLHLERFNPLAPNVYFIDKYECYTPYKAGRYKLNFEMIVTLNDGRIFTSRKQMNCIETMSENKCVMVDSFVNYSHRKMIINQHSLFLTTNAKEQLIKKYIKATTTTTKKEIDDNNKSDNNDSEIAAVVVK